MKNIFDKINAAWAFIFTKEPQPVPPPPPDRIAELMAQYKAEGHALPCTLGLFAAYLKKHGIMVTGLGGQLRQRGAKSTLVTPLQENGIHPASDPVRMWAW